MNAIVPIKNPEPQVSGATTAIVNEQRGSPWSQPYSIPESVPRGTTVYSQRSSKPMMQNQYVLLVNLAGMASMTTASAKMPFPEQLYIPIHEVVMRISAAVFLLCG